MQHLRSNGIRLLSAGLLVGVLAAVACGGSSAPTSPTPPVVPAPPTPPVEPTPTPPPSPPTPPPPPPNNAPLIKSLKPTSDRVEADEEVQLIAEVEDTDTPVDQLAFEWTAEKGVFIGSGRQVRWQAPRLQRTPDVYALKLTVIERYTVNGEAKEHRTSASVNVRYNDSYREIRDMTLVFLGDFATSTTSAEICVRNFSNRCPGKFEELAQIQDNRRRYQILGGTFSIADIRLNADKTLGNVTAPCQFRSILKATGQTETATGTCLVTAVYEDWQWFLCESHFAGSTAVSDPKHSF